MRTILLKLFLRFRFISLDRTKTIEISGREILPYEILAKLLEKGVKFGIDKPLPELETEDILNIEFKVPSLDKVFSTVVLKNIQSFHSASICFDEESDEELGQLAVLTQVSEGLADARDAVPHMRNAGG